MHALQRGELFFSLVFLALAEQGIMGELSRKTKVLRVTYLNILLLRMPWSWKLVLICLH